MDCFDSSVMLRMRAANRFSLCDTIDQFIPEKHEKIEKRTEHFGQLLSRPVHETEDPPSSILP